MSDTTKKVKAEADLYIDQFIEKINADDSEAISMGRDQACMMRDEIGRLRRSDQAHEATKRELEKAQAKLDRMPEDWDKDSSLATWFPITAEELKRTNTSLAECQRDRDALRKALIDSGRICGAVLADNVSVEFLTHVPEEINLYIARLRSKGEKENACE